MQQVEFARSVIRSNKRSPTLRLTPSCRPTTRRSRKTPLPPKHQTGSTGRPLDRLSTGELQSLQQHIRSLWNIARQLRKNASATAHSIWK